MARIAIRMSDQERIELEKHSKKNKKTLSEYIRLRLFEPDTLETRINFFENIQNLQIGIDNLKNQSDILAQYLIENQKSNAMLLNIIYQFMVEKLGREESKAIVERVKNFVEGEQQ